MANKHVEPKLGVVPKLTQNRSTDFEEFISRKLATNFSGFYVNAGVRSSGIFLLWREDLSTSCYIWIELSANRFRNQVYAVLSCLLVKGFWTSSSAFQRCSPCSASLSLNQSTSVPFSHLLKFQVACYSICLFFIAKVVNHFDWLSINVMSRQAPCIDAVWTETYISECTTSSSPAAYWSKLPFVIFDLCVFLSP